MGASQRYVERRYAQMVLDYADTEFAAKVNNYICPKCGHITKTIDVDPGVTPFMEFYEDKCGEFARSTFYKDYIPEQMPTHEWYRPDLKEVLKLRKKPEILDHILQGGLLIRKIV